MLGRRWVEGYYVTDDGLTATHWYARWALYAFNASYFLACLGVPVITIFGSMRAIREWEDGER